MLYVVPHRFTRIRYYGILSHRNKSKALKECNEFYKIKEDKKIEVKNWREVYLKITGVDLSICPKCKTGTMEVKEILTGIINRAPPV